MSSLYETSIVKDLGTRKVNRPSKTLGFTYERYFLVRCFCGKKFETRAGNYRAGAVRSCGCSRAVTHGGYMTPEYQSWKAMKSRCLRKTNVSYDRYGGRGIKICNSWLGKDGFANFLKDMGNRERKDLTLDRINPDGDYEPTNCRWADKLTQTHNRSKLL